MAIAWWWLVRSANEVRAYRVEDQGVLRPRRAGRVVLVRQPYVLAGARAQVGFRVSGFGLG
eukprot:CAMPEP_0180172034 /NCGR_PEP_ID=MMETSP0986-20121125/34777_1 /TAXON_ID=697907 /ORGANISM="non described non described, Strain CCMP2293" /LENGTH=60 /DNA_ID=CAMNT_0022124029 /DNA_START=344 /DNA_END=522 /DNA_ORIENTATION=+